MAKSFQLHVLLIVSHVKSMLRAFNETLGLQRSTTKRCSQMGGGLPGLSSPLFAALMYQDSSGGFRAITNPTGTTACMAAGSDFLKQKEGMRVGWLQVQTDAQTPLLFRTVFQGQHLVVIVCLMSPWLAPCCSSTRGCQTSQPSTPYPPLEWPPLHPWNFHVDRLLFF